MGPKELEFPGNLMLKSSTARGQLVSQERCHRALRTYQTYQDLQTRPDQIPDNDGSVMERQTTP